MGTKADFYLGRGPSARWLGSAASAGRPVGIPMKIRGETEEARYIDAVTRHVRTCGDGVLPNPEKLGDGWPWEWTSSASTDFAYAFYGGRVWVSRMGHQWHEADIAWPDETLSAGGTIEAFPEMTGELVVRAGRAAGQMQFGVRSRGRPRRTT